MWKYNYSTPQPDELYHYGVPGMRWGHRRSSYASEKSAYKQAKKEERQISRSKPNIIRSFGVNGIKQVTEHNKKVSSASVKTADAKAKLSAAKSKNPDKAEFNSYAKSMRKTGLAGSINDSNSGGKSTRLYDHLTVTKGKAYADRVQKKVEKELVTTIAASTAVLVGSAAAQVYLLNK